MTIFRRRIMGIEVEYGIACVADSTKRLGPEETARYMFRPVIEEWGSSNIFHPNASRLYLDVGSHPEIATAECDSLRQLIAYEHAGDRIVDQLATDAEASLARDGIGGQVYLFKNNLDTVGNSYGCHENYLVSRDVVLKHLGRDILAFLITRQLIAGAGHIVDGKFQLSQRADHVWEGVSSATTRSRPIINTRDEPHADSHRFRRLHIIVGDSNMSEVTTALKVGSTLLVLEMIEAGEDFSALALNDISAIKAISRDITGNAPVTLASGETMTALEIQRAYLEAAKRWLVKRADTNAELGTPQEDMQQVVTLWEKTLNAIESGDLTSISTDIDWAIKYTLLKRFQGRLGLEADDFSHPKLKQIDLTYHDIRPGRGLFKALEAKGVASRFIDDEAVTKAMNQPPQTTRAKLRGEFITHAHKVGAPVSVDWLRLKVSRPEPQLVELLDPFQSHSDEVKPLIDYMNANGEHYQ